MNEQMKNYAEQMVSRKNFDAFTRDKVLDYIDSHDKMYGNFIDTREVINRIENNLDKSINFDFSSKSSLLSRGGANAEFKKIDIYTKDFGDDEYFHEIDHIATADLSESPDLTADDAWSHEAMEKRDSQGYVIKDGIQRSVQVPNGKFEIFFKNENEGITVMKQRDYAKLKGIPFKENGYDFNYNVSEQLAYLVGKENLLNMHFHNDVEGLCEKLKEYNLDFNELCALSQKIQSTNVNSLDFYNQVFDKNENTNKKDYEMQYQTLLDNAFIAKRCQELGINYDENYYKNLSKDYIKTTELKQMQSFSKYKVSEVSSLESKEQDAYTLSNKKNIFEKFKSLFSKKQKNLPDVQKIPTEEKAPKKESIPSWDLQNWNIDSHEFRVETREKVSKTLEQKQPKEVEKPNQNIER